MQSHYFIAVPLPADVKSKVKNSFTQRTYPFKRWVHEEDLHLTLVFLGACTNEQLQKVQASCRSLLSNWGEFSLETSALGTYGSKTNPRIFWLGVKDEPKLYRLQQDIFTICVEAGFSLDKRAFSPHITLARKWVGDEPYVPDQEGIMAKEQWLVSDIVLYQSVLTETPKYKTIERFPLGEKQ
ncbi:RNA 2',3'-cyclic phosphodiesterase [Alkalihalobacillus sp. MEB130]|uniref:RNA 2',3'-cyclic phosphodiesterase n=1 Tax=Alkalihalobacillus sp. MEB130 TaxID=2976704 RepID=UPI0028DECB1A|nr:RNA 2',3'-cyclic phosphodiesterase [Alkalihalobacillus sp. MEB130]MDT8859338.1 RNA 2',3'-cyclic phosphodiesterase [Alkalihalobacillus sp. MEB130]